MTTYLYILCSLTCSIFMLQLTYACMHVYLFVDLNFFFLPFLLIIEICKNKLIEILLAKDRIATLLLSLGFLGVFFLLIFFSFLYFNYSSSTDQIILFILINNTVQPCSILYVNTIK